jgi:hypothetical protein
MLQCQLQMSIMLERSTPHFHIWEVTGSITGPWRPAVTNELH